MQYLTISMANCVANSSQVETDINTIKTQLMAFQAVNGRLSTVEEGINALITNPDLVNLHKWVQLATRIPTGPWGHFYQYGLHATDLTPKSGIYSFGPDGVA